MTMIADIGPASIVRGDAEPGAQLTGRLDLLHDFRSARSARRGASRSTSRLATTTRRRATPCSTCRTDRTSSTRPHVCAGAGLGPRRGGGTLIGRGKIARGPRQHRSRPHRSPRRPHAEPRSAAACHSRLAAYRRMLVDELEPSIDAAAGARGRSGYRYRRLVAGELAARAENDAAQYVRTVHGTISVAVVASAPRARSCPRSGGPSAVSIWLDAGTQEGHGVLHHARMLKNILLAMAGASARSALPRGRRPAPRRPTGPGARPMCCGRCFHPRAGSGRRGRRRRSGH